MHFRAERCTLAVPARSGIEEVSVVKVVKRRKLRMNVATKAFCLGAAKAGLPAFAWVGLTAGEWVAVLAAAKAAG